MSVSSPTSTPAVDATPHPSDDETPDRAGLPDLGGPGIEIGEGTREHHRGENGVGVHERAVGVHDGQQIRSGIVRLRERIETAAQLSKPLEEDLPYEPGLVAEELVHRGDRRFRALGDVASREAGDAVLVEHGDRNVEHAVAQLRCALFRPRHSGAYGKLNAGRRSAA